MKTRYFIEISFKGTNYVGWQAQKNGISIQTTLDEALSKILQDTVTSLGAGRTDSGVHAESFMAHFDTHSDIDQNTVFKLNCFLPPNIAVKNIFTTKEKQNARFDCISRSYRYIISSQKSPFLENEAWVTFRKFDIDKMNKAANILLTTKDFQAFSRVQTNVKHFRCDVQHAEWKKKGNTTVFNIKANRFLRGMVRAIVGTTLKVGLGAISLKEFKDVIRSKDRTKAGAAANPYGLYFMKAEYPFKLTPVK
ncbi:MAG: tRNA pseudouridine(38-40) synthase TruA [Deltaproteobacteria bacterium]|nr:tRNA pseudouridine(38-40) synthase TruA [Deltaproteobacteria bacterium]